MAMMLGSFTNGLFGGAQSALSLYSMYQGISAQIDMQAKKDAAEAEDKANRDFGQNVEQGVVGRLRSQEGTPGVDQPADKAIQPSPAEATPAAPAAPSGTDKGPVKTENLPKPTASTGSVNSNASSDPYRKDPGTGLPVSTAPAAATTPPQAPPASDPYRMPQTTGIGGTPFNAAGVQGLPGSPSGPPQYSATPSGPPGTSFGLSGEPQPYAPPTPWIVQQGQQLIARGQDMIRGVAAGAHATNPATMPPSQMYGGTGFGPPALPPAYTAPTTEPIPSSQPGRPVIPPEQRPPPAAPAQAPISASPYNPAGAPGGAGTQSGGAAVPPTPGTGLTVLPPGGGGEPVTGGVPQASNAPAPSLGAKIGGMLSSVGSAIIPSAEAATRPTAGQSAAANAAQPGAPTLPPAQTEPQPAASTPAPAASAPAQGVGAPAATTPATAKAPTPPAAGPVTVEGDKAKVAPGQTSETQQSANTPVARAPVPDVTYVKHLEAIRPDVAEEIKKTLAQVDPSNPMAYPVMAAVVARESTYGTNPDAHGNIMQVKPDAQADVEKALRRKLDLSDWRQSVLAGVVYQKILNDEFGANTLESNLAYRAGPAVVRSIAKFGMDDAMKLFPHLGESLDDIAKMYNSKDVDVKNIKYYSGGNGGNNAVDIPTAVKTAQEQGPDGALNYIAQTGAAGAGMTDKWRAFQSAAENYAIWSGHPEMIPQVIEWTAQLSHQGAVSNLIAGYQAMQAGDMATAGGLFMRSHAFFPDGSYARAGTDKSGRLWIEQFSESTGQALGKPFQVTPEMVATQIIGLQHPTTFLETLQKMQLNTAKIDLDKAHTKYYGQLPGIAEAKLEGQQQGMETRLQERLAATAHENELKRQHQFELQDAKAGSSNAADERAVGSQINKEYAPDAPGLPGELPSQLPKQAQIDAILRRNTASGGASMAGPISRETARDLINNPDGKGAHLRRGTDDKGNMRDAVIGKDGTIRGYLSTDQGDRIRGLAGSQKLPTTSNAQHTSVIGAGGGSQMAATQGLNQNLSGIPMQSLPQQQPQQAAA